MNPIPTSRIDDLLSVWYRAAITLNNRANKLRELNERDAHILSGQDRAAALILDQCADMLRRERDAAKSSEPQVPVIGLAVGGFSHEVDACWAAWKQLPTERNPPYEYDLFRAGWLAALFAVGRPVTKSRF